MKRLIGFTMVALILLSLSSCKGAGKTTFSYSSASVSSNADSQVFKNEWLMPDSEEVTEHKANLQMLCGEVWHNDVYEKDAIEIPELEAEETVEGQLWFPPVNNTTPLEEIAPTISYELMLKGYYISPYYPDNPEDYTAQAINENAFPIAFFRKVNDLVYYTVCKVEGGGYMYYFFMAKSGYEADYNTAHFYDDFASRLYDPENKDLESMDLTKEVIWRGSVYSESSAVSVAELAAVGFKDEIMDNLPIDAVAEADPAVMAVLDLAPEILSGLGSNKSEQYVNLRQLNEVLCRNYCYLYSKSLCSDGILLKSYDYMQTDSFTGKSEWVVSGSEQAGYIKSNPYLFGMPLLNKAVRMGGTDEQPIYGSSSISELLTEDNMVLMRILDCDYRS